MFIRLMRFLVGGDMTITLLFRWLREVDAREKVERRLAARERELERIRGHLYKNRVEEFEKIKRGE